METHSFPKVSVYTGECSMTCNGIIFPLVSSLPVEAWNPLIAWDASASSKRTNCLGFVHKHQTFLDFLPSVFCCFDFLTFLQKIQRWGRTCSVLLLLLQTYDKVSALLSFLQGGISSECSVLTTAVSHPAPWSTLFCNYWKNPHTHNKKKVSDTG